MIHLATPYGMDAASGYGKMASRLRQALIDCGEAVRQYVPGTDKPGQVLVIGSPFVDTAQRLRDRRAWLYTMSESDRVSPQWVSFINEAYAGVIVPCRTLVDVYEGSGMSVPVKYVPLGVTVPSPQPQRMTPTEHFRVIGYSLNDNRKGDELTLQAFMQVFGKAEDVQLVMKTSGPSWWDGCLDRRVQVVKEPLTEPDWYRMLATGHVFIFPSRGEGFGLPPREAVMCGTPTIATKWLGMADVGRWGFPIRIKEMVAAEFAEVGANAADAKWSEPDFEHICTQLQLVRAEPTLAADQTIAGRQWLIDNCSWESCAFGVLGAINA